MKEILYEGYTIYVGENANENQELVVNGNPNDYWAHISGYPSAHAVICNPNGDRVHNKVIKRACCIIKSSNNKCKSISKLQFDVCRISNINTTDTPGLVELIEPPKKITV
jgi:predicted ribosome quality control (RQC) complex YloA/Tae2 family protein